MYQTLKTHQTTFFPFYFQYPFSNEHTSYAYEIMSFQMVRWSFSDHPAYHIHGTFSVEVKALYRGAQKYCPHFPEG